MSGISKQALIFLLFFAQMANPYKKNIKYLYLVKISKWFNMVMPVVYLFYVDNGMGMEKILILKSIYSIAIVTMEIPSGYMADVWGRKKTLLLGSILGALGFITYSFSFAFWGFVMAEIILGIGHSFVSGADSAMLYDSLKASGNKKDYIKQEGRVTSIGNFAEAFAGILGGLLATISYRTPFFFQTVVAAMAIPASLLMVEPAMHGKKLFKSVSDVVQRIRDTFATQVDLRVAILLSALTGTATLTFAWFVQPFFKEIGLSAALFGVFWTLLNLAVGTSSVFAHKVERYLGRKKSVLLIIALIAIGFITSGLSITYWGLAFLFFFYLSRGVATPILKNYINQYTGSEVRATMLSVRNFVIRINFAVIGPALGWLTDHISLKVALVAAGGLYFIASMVAVFPWLRKSRQ